MSSIDNVYIWAYTKYENKKKINKNHHKYSTSILVKYQPNHESGKMVYVSPCISPWSELFANYFL